MRSTPSSLPAVTRPEAGSACADGERRSAGRASPPPRLRLGLQPLACSRSPATLAVAAPQRARVQQPQRAALSDASPTAPLLQSTVSTSSAALRAIARTEMAAAAAAAAAHGAR